MTAAAFGSRSNTSRESLLTAVGEASPVDVYSAFDASCILELAEALLDRSMADLLQLVWAHFHLPQLHGSFSIKSVLPALVPHLGCDDLAISDGTLASMAYAELQLPETTPERGAEIRPNFLAYCKSDTLAEVELFRFFRA